MTFLKFFKVYFIDYAITVFPIFPPLSHLHPVPPNPPAFPTLSSRPWVVHISSLSSLFPTPFFYLSPSILCPPIMLLLPCTSPLFLPSPCPLNTLHWCPFLTFKELNPLQTSLYKQIIRGCSQQYLLWMEKRINYESRGSSQSFHP